MGCNQNLPPDQNQQVENQTGVQGIAYAPEVDRIYVGLGTNGLCNVLNADTLKAVKTLKFADDCDNVRYNPPGVNTRTGQLSNLFESMIPIVPSAGILIEF